MKRICLIVLIAGCLPTLPDPVYSGDSKVFESHQTVYQNAQACGSHLNGLRSKARNRALARLIATVLGGATTTVSGYVAATKATDDPDTAKTSAQIALVGGLIAVAAQAIPDSTEALDKYRAASSSWAEARRLALSGGTEPQMFQSLDDCRNDVPSKPSASTKIGAPL